jgi:hypothetical protein
MNNILTEKELQKVLWEGFLSSINQRIELEESAKRDDWNGKVVEKIAS